MSYLFQETPKDARGASELTRLLYCFDLESKFTEDELKKWWVARCVECGWCGLSKHLGTDRPLGMTGCCGDIYCPKCNSTDVDDYVRWAGWKWELTFWWKKISFYAYRKKRREEKKLEQYIKQYEANRTEQEAV